MRNYQKEADWSRNKYEEIRGKINKELGMKLREKLKNDGKSIAEWITENAKKYLKK